MPADFFRHLSQALVISASAALCLAAARTLRDMEPRTRRGVRILSWIGIVAAWTAVATDAWGGLHG